ncbi:helix-turn-helix domain-containing protein [Clostridium tyrobutyricum]|uniref:helix-turn-helix domain-containing protein n=1 Tax=Clostridium tyrobutyricum TaxID=1519 RepID=UPI000B17A10E|nr:helix-turn-helix transcriptional regulator [Clostridium tyrobutyricum]
MFGKNLRKIRINFKWSQKFLSEKTGIPQTTISDIETGKSIANVEQALSISKALDIPLNKLLGLG